MVRAIYEIKLKESYFPAMSGAEALHMHNSVTSGTLQEEDLDIKVAVNAEDTLKLFLLCKTMYDMEKFTFKEVWSAVKSLAVEMGYFASAEKLADTVTTWTERLAEDMTLQEFQEWLIS